MLTRRGCLGRLVAGIAALVGLRAATTPKVRDWMMNVTPAATLPDPVRLSDDTAFIDVGRDEVKVARTTYPAHWRYWKPIGFVTAETPTGWRIQVYGVFQGAGPPALGVAMVRKG